MWQLSLPYWEFVVRGVVVYVFLSVLLRITSKRQIGQLAPFDMVLLLVLSNAVQNSMNGGDNSITGGVILAVTLIAINSLVAYLTRKSKRIALIVEGKPSVLIHNGKINEAELKKRGLTHHELNAALRAEGCLTVAHVLAAVLEANGRISVIQSPDEHEEPTPQILGERPA